MAHECEYCGESQKNQQGRAAHERFCDENPNNQETSEGASQKEATKIQEKSIEIDSEFYVGEVGQLEVIDKKEPESTCSECGAPVKPGTNCKDCGAELDWYLAA